MARHQANTDCEYYHTKYNFKTDFDGITTPPRFPLKTFDRNRLRFDLFCYDCEKEKRLAPWARKKNILFNEQQREKKTNGNIDTIHN